MSAPTHLDGAGTVDPLPPASGPPVSPLTWRQSLALLGSVLAVVVAVLGAVVVVLLLAPGARGSASTMLAWSVPGMSGAVLVVLHVGLRRCGTDWRGLGFVAPTWRMLHLLWQVPAALVAVLAVQVVAAAVVGVEPPSDEDGVEAVLRDVAVGPAVAVFVGVALLVPLWEEAVFRGVVHGGLRRRFGVPAAALLSGGVFGLAHGVPVLMPYLVTAGVCLALVHEFHRTLWAPVLVHVLLNASVTLPVLLAVVGR